MVLLRRFSYLVVSLLVAFLAAGFIFVPPINVVGGVPPGTPTCVATGGTITTDGAYTVHKFTSSGTFQITSVTGGATCSVEYLVVAGGGGGGANHGAGGGAGGFITSSFERGNGSYTVTVGTSRDWINYRNKQGG